MSINRNPVFKRLKEARLAAGISQKKLGIAAGVDEFTASARMNQYETGKHIPDYLTLKRVGKILGCPVAFFYAEDDLLADIILLTSSLNKEQKKKVLEIIEAL